VPQYSWFREHFSRWLRAHGNDEVEVFGVRGLANLKISKRLLLSPVCYALTLPGDEFQHNMTGPVLIS
jgi:hypothetical protein